MCSFQSTYPEKGLNEVAGRTFDYIIVGGGTAGCAVASRLSEDPTVSVLVLEKGQINDSWYASVPLISAGLADTIGVYRRDSEPIEACNGRPARVWSSESLGGSSRINAMIYTRGAPAMFDEWAAMGHPTWDWKSVEPYYKKLENATSHPNSPHLGHAGPVHTIQKEPAFEAYHHLEKSAAALGLPVEKDINSPTAPASGYFYFDHTINAKSWRHSALHAYLPKHVALDRQSHLSICTGIQVTRLELDPDEGLATGVYAEPCPLSSSSSNHPLPTLIHARREVIICGGAIRTPALLQRSGIGPSELLAQHSIPVIRNLPAVGANLADHHAMPLGIQLPFPHTLHQVEKYPLQAAWHLARYFLGYPSVMEASTTASAIYLRTSDVDGETGRMIATREINKKTTKEEEDRRRGPPDVEIMLFPANATGDVFRHHSVFTLYVCLTQPRSCGGSVRIASASPQDEPLLKMDMLSSEEDLKVARKALRFGMNLVEEFRNRSGWTHRSKLWMAPGVKVPNEGFKTGAEWDDDDDDEAAEKKKNFPEPDWRDLEDGVIDDWARERISSALHLACTCRMGPRPSSPGEEGGTGGVVDDELRVHGFRNLRIADASVFPKIPPTHTMAPTYMVAERCADFIKAAWGGGRTM